MAKIFGSFQRSGIVYQNIDSADIVAGDVWMDHANAEIKIYNGTVWEEVGTGSGSGFTGSQGFTGSIGFTGSKGDQGVAGFTGSAGAQGLIGFTGSRGIQGNVGFTGSKGDQGDIGFTGSKGDTGFNGSTGDQGIQGFTGSAGSQGLIGFTGSRGIQGNVGFTGSKGDQGIIGFTGSKGDTGFDGSKGDQGDAGFNGSTGDQGLIGFTGSKGDQGIVGFTGSKGDQGVIGFTGSKGDIGFTGSKGDVGFNGSIGFTGSQGGFGGVTFAYAWSTDTTLTDPGTGTVKINNANLTSGTILSIDDEDANGTDIQQFLRTIDDSTSAIKGHFRVANRLNADDYAMFTISSISEETGYFEVTVAYLEGSATSFTNGEELIMTFARTGDKGDTGFTGSKGDIGFTGSQGFTGSKGDQGIIGFTGSKGDQGITGFTGSAGGQGLIGFTGSKGDQGDAGFNGSTGDQGLIGFTGSKGDTGFNGSIGDQGIIGFTGSQGDQGLIGFTGSKGDQGDAGFNGSKGDQGNTGFNGSKGDQGDTGFTGSKGDTGFTGSAGSQGLIGFTGSKGDQGIVGFTGSQGGVGFTGSQGDTAIGGAFVHTQSSAAVSWSITHDLDSQYVNVEVIDDFSNSMVGTSNYPIVTFTNGNVTTLTFPEAVSGYAAITSGGGQTGSTGTVGFTGSKGDTGFTGSTGFNGSVGFTGSASTVQGPIGFTGSKGDTGFTGSASTVPGPTGFTGSKGDTGFTGSIGFSGSEGPSSFSTDANNSITLGTDSLLMVDPEDINTLRLDFTVLPVGPDGVADNSTYLDENNFMKVKAYTGVREKHAFVFAGQSNMVGRATFDNGTTHPANVYQYDQAGNLVAPTNPLDHVDPQSGDMGIDITFTQQYMLANPNVDMILIPVAEGGTGFSTNDWNVGDATYENAVSQIQGAFTDIAGLQMKGFLWHQGEADKAPTPRANYSTAWNAMMTNLISRTAVTAETPTIMGGLYANGTDAAAMDIVLEGVADARDYTTFVTTSDLTSFDNLHFDAASTRTLGNRYYANWTISRMADQRAEFGAQAHWLFGSVDGSLTDMVAGLTATSADTLITGTNYVSTANVILSGLDSQIPGSDEQTVIVVIKENVVAANQIRFGNLFAPGEGNGRSVFLGGSNQRFNDRNGIGFVEMQNPFDRTNPWTFSAFSYTQTGANAPDADALLYANPSTGIQTFTGTGPANSEIRNIGFGNLHYNSASFPTGSTFAEAIIFDRALTKTELDGIFTRSVLRMSVRGITLSTGTTGVFDV